MTSSPVYLRPDVVVQPLVDRWYAWSHLVPPLTLGLNHADRHLRIMDSYVAAPYAHAAAAADPALAGGPFVDVEGDRSDDVAALADHIRTKRANVLNAAAGVQALWDLVADEATGYCIENLYKRVDPLLRGCIELAYDVRHQAVVRIIEPLVYASGLHDPSVQSLVLFKMKGDDRPFVLSTPSLDGPDRVHLDWTFAAAELDRLASLKWDPQQPEDLTADLGLDSETAQAFSSFLTPTPPRRPTPYAGPGVRWRYFGHACVLVEAGGVSVLTDPLVSYNSGGALPRYTFEDLPPTIDCALITHAHQDHFVLETLLQLRHRLRTVVVPRNGGGSLQDPSLALILRQAGFKDVVEVDEFNELDLGPVVVKAMPFMGEHADLDIRSKITYLVQAGGRKLFFAADTANVDPCVYQRVRDVIGTVDTLFLGMECDGAPLNWLYGPAMMVPKTAENRAREQSRRLSGSDCERAASLVQCLEPQEAFVYSMGQEPWLRYLLSLEYQPDSLPIVESNKLIAWCRSTGRESRRLLGHYEAIDPFVRALPTRRGRA